MCQKKKDVATFIILRLYNFFRFYVDAFVFLIYNTT